MLESPDACREFERIGTLDELSPINRAIGMAVIRYRELDKESARVSRELLQSQLEREIKNDKHIEPLRGALRSIPSDVPTGNIREHVNALHKQRTGEALSLVLANGASPEEINRLIQEYSATGNAGDSRGPASLVDIFDTSDLTQEIQNSDTFIKLWPKGLNDRLDGGALRGHHVLLFARPETGKTLFSLNLCAGFLHQKLSVLYVGNEEPSADIRDRIRGRLLKVSKSFVRANGGVCADRLAKADVGKLHIIQETTFQAVRAELQAGEYDVVIFDQLRNMRLKSDSRTAELEAAGIEARAIAKESQVLVISITQAGDSATGKVYLDMSDVDSSKTGLPASADLMIGLGSDDAMKLNGLMGVSLPKNKLSGLHDKFTLTTNFQTGVIE